jgi:hypothetical protein
VGPPVFKTGDAALGAAWWVRLPCAPARRAAELTGEVTATRFTTGLPWPIEMSAASGSSVELDGGRCSS